MNSEGVCHSRSAGGGASKAGEKDTSTGTESDDCDSGGEAASAVAMVDEIKVARVTPRVPGADPDQKVITFRRASVVYACITRWNFPMNIPAESSDGGQTVPAR